MTKKFHILLFVFMLGFFAKPTVALACGTDVNQIEKSCCSKEKSSVDKKDCCKNAESEREKKDNKCNGSCKSCSCLTTHFTYALPVIELKDHTFKYFSQKPQFINHECYLSAGYYSIWTPPNIG